jgi:hypothetical protein
VYSAFHIWTIVSVFGVNVKEFSSDGGMVGLLFPSARQSADACDNRSDGDSDDKQEGDERYFVRAGEYCRKEAGVWYAWRGCGGCRIVVRVGVVRPFAIGDGKVRLSTKGYHFSP